MQYLRAEQKATENAKLALEKTELAARESKAKDDASRLAEEKGELAASETAAKNQFASKVREFDQLAGVVLYERAIANEKKLYPAWPSRVEAMETWLREDAGKLIAMKDGIEQTVRVLEARALPPTAEEIEADRRTHPQFAAFELLGQRVASLRRAQAIRGGEPLVLPELSVAQQALDVLALHAFALARVAPTVKVGTERRKVYGEEALGLAAARLAATKAKGTPDECIILSLLGRALVANGQDAEAKQALERAYDLAPEQDASRYEQDLHDIEKAGMEAGAALATAEQELTALAVVLGERRTWRFDLESQGFLHDTLAELLGKLGSLEANETTAVGHRLSWAKQVQQLTLAHPNSRHTWAAVRSAIAQSPKYACQTIELRDQDITGLVPIGENPVTHLWEFYELRSAWNGRQDPRTIAIPAHELDGSIKVTGDTGIVFVLLPGGTFLMGAQSRDQDGLNFDASAGPNESPVHEVTLAPFFLARHEVTRGQWQRLAASRPFWLDNGVNYLGDRIAIGPSHPADSMDWDMANQCMERSGLVLPTEAQWEYGCRAGTATPWWPGREAMDLQGCANVHDKTSVERQPQWGVPAPITDGFAAIAPVGSFRANVFGLFDVHGNVFEWCRDWFGGYDAGVHPGDGDRLVGSASGNRVHRGGSFVYGPSSVRSALRFRGPPSYRSGNLGLRPARTLRP